MEIAATTLQRVDDQSVTSPATTPASSPVAPPATRGDSISLSDRAAVAARDGEKSPSLFLLSAKQQKQLNGELTSGHGWHDDAETGALLLRANASPYYVKRFISPAHFQEATAIDSRRDEAADAPLNSALAAGYHAITDTLAMGRNGVQSVAATGTVNMHPTQQQADANRAVLRQRIAEVSWQSTDPTQHLIGAAYANYDREPEAMWGALDLALDTATDPLTYASLGSDAIAGAAGRVVGQAPQISEAMRDGGAGILRGLDDAASNVLRSSQRLQPVGAGVPASVSDGSGVGVLEKRPISVGAPSRGNFSADEAAGGHTIAKHFYKSDAKLRGRFEREPDLQQSSAFLNEASASKAFSSLEKQHAREINDWKKSGSHNLFTRKVNVGSPIGRVLDRGSDSSDLSNAARFVLVADSSQRGWHVLTAFPVRQ